MLCVILEVVGFECWRYSALSFTLHTDGGCRSQQAWPVDVSKSNEDLQNPKAHVVSENHGATCNEMLQASESYPKWSSARTPLTAQSNPVKLTSGLLHCWSEIRTPELGSSQAAVWTWISTAGVLYINCWDSQGWQFAKSNAQT